jgi:hypothetical protein
MKRIKNVLEAKAPQRAVERMARAKQDERIDLLSIAQYFTAKSDREDPSKVMVVAEQLLAWLDESTNALDRAARRAALRKVEAAPWGMPQPASAPELIERASVYYEFIAA